MPEVIYVAGAARSGSTLLASLLGQLPAAVNVGELYFLWDRGLIGGWRCGCGDPVPDCVLWSKVVATVGGGLDPEEMTRIRDRHVKTRHVPRLLRGGRSRPTSCASRGRWRRRWSLPRSCRGPT